MSRKQKRQERPRLIKNALARMSRAVDRANPDDREKFYKDFHWVTQVAQTNAQRHRAARLEREFAHAIDIEPESELPPFLQPR